MLCSHATGEMAGAPRDEWWIERAYTAVKLPSHPPLSEKKCFRAKNLTPRRNWNVLPIKPAAGANEYSFGKLLLLPSFVRSFIIINKIRSFVRSFVLIIMLTFIYLFACITESTRKTKNHRDLPRLFFFRGVFFSARGTVFPAEFFFPRLFFFLRSSVFCEGACLSSLIFFPR